MDVDPSEPSVSCTRDGHRAEVVFNNPTRHNAMSLSMWRALFEHMTDLASDDSVRLAVLSGAGHKAFVSGSDISEFDSQRSTSSGAADYTRLVDDAEFAVDAFPKPTIAKIQGYCLGGGLGIALGCDLRICSEDATFSIPAGKLGLGYSYRGAARLFRLLGQPKASELFYTAERIDAQQALQLGLVNRVVASDTLDQVVDELGSRITANAPKTMAAFKACANEWKLPDNQGSHEAIDAMVESCYVSEDYAEGRLAFREKRAPVFRGK